MIGGISMMQPSYSFMYNRLPLAGAEQAQNAQQAGLTRQAGAAGQTGGVWAAHHSAGPDTPVQPVSPVRPVSDQEASQPIRLGPVLREGADPAEMAVRMRIRPYEEAGAANAPEKALEGNQAAGVESAQEALEEGKCETCEKRKYQDGSDDMGVSFQTPTNIKPEQAASAVRGHEMEHVIREQAKADREGRKVVSQNVTMHTEICPECGKSYVSGGTTRTVTKAADSQQAQQQPKEGQDSRVPFSAVA